MMFSATLNSVIGMCYFTQTTFLAHQILARTAACVKNLSALSYASVLRELQEIDALTEVSLFFVAVGECV